MSSDEPSAPVGVPLGEVIGGYRLVRLIGAGSTSHVYLAQHARLGRPAAIKVLHASLVDNPQVVQRMLTEARVVNDIRHPNIVDIIDFVDQDKPRRVALVMEHIAGPSVDSLRGGEPLPWRQASGIARQLVDAVEAAHRAGVVHRDLKPDNLLLATDPRTARHIVPQLKVVDFGIAKVAGPNFGHQTATQTMLGTPAYMAPEQIAQSPPPSGATDVFAVGEILYELLSGQRAYRAARLSDVVRQKLRGQVPDLPLPAAVPGRAELQTLIRRCLAFQPDHRPKLTEVVGLLSRLKVQASQPASRSPEVPVGEWGQLEGSADDLLSEATQLNELVGLSSQQTQALWRPDARPVDEETLGLSGPTHLAVKSARQTLENFEETEPFSSDEFDSEHDYIGVPTLAQPYDLEDQAVLKAETAMSAEALVDGEEAAARKASGRSGYEEMPTRDSLPMLGADTAPSGFKAAAVEPAETLIGRPASPEDPGAPKSPLVPARDGGPPVSADDPLAERWASTVIKPKPRDRSGPTYRDPPLPEPRAGEPRSGVSRLVEARPAGWAETFERALNARQNAAPDGRSGPTPDVRRSGPHEVRVVGADSRVPADSPRLGAATPVRFGEAKVATRVERRARSWLLLLVPALCALMVVVFAFAVPTARGRRGPAVTPLQEEASVEVRSQPPEAFVEDAETGAFLGKTPVPIAIPTGGTRKVRVFKAGFTARVVELTSDAPSTWIPLIRE